MNEPTREPDGRLRVPRRAESEQGDVGTGWVLIGPDDSEFAEWDGYLQFLDGDSDWARRTSDRVES